jgi:uncharacterized protein YdhG (YjbR/CyaY superfamily)
MATKPAANIDEYIAKYPAEVQVLLQQMRSIIRKAAPKATEDIKWGMPTFVHHGNLVHFAAHKHHMGFYPAPSALKAFEKDLSKFTYSKGAVQFPYSDKLPITLIAKMVKYRVKENEAKVKK